MKKIKLTSTAAKKIKQALKHHKITQEDFAEDYLNVTLRTFQNYLMSKTAIPLDKLDIIQKTFTLSIKELFGDIPKGFPREKHSFTQILRNALKLNFLMEVSQYYKTYTDWFVDRVHFHPYPLEGSFKVIAHQQATNGKNYYRHLSIVSTDNKIPVNEQFIIGYVLLAGRLRVDYGWMTVREHFIEVRESFTNNSVAYTVPIDKKLFQQTGEIFQLITWFGEEDCTFVIRSKYTGFDVINAGRSDYTESEIVAMRGVNKVVFQRAVWHETASDQ